MPRVVTDEVDSTLAQPRVVIIHPLILVIIPHCKLQHTSTYLQGMPETVVQCTRGYPRHHTRIR